MLLHRLRNFLYCVEWDVKLYYTIPLCYYIMQYSNTENSIFLIITFSYFFDALMELYQTCRKQYHFLKIMGHLYISTFRNIIQQQTFRMPHRATVR